MLTKIGLEVIAVDCLGYGRSDAPGTHKISAYTYKRIAEDIGTLCQQLGISNIILGGHDWGGAIVYRVAQLQPKLVKSLFVICTPYAMPTPEYVPLQVIVDTRLPNFAYQLHFASGELEDAIKSPQEIRNFLNALYGARTVTNDGSKGENAWKAEGRVALDLLPKMGKSTLLSDEEMDYYVHEYSRHGMNGALNWYRSSEQRYLDDLNHFFSGSKTDPKKDAREIKVDQPTLYVFATNDTALPGWMNKPMDARIPRLTRATVKAGHWVLWEKPGEVNAIIKKWIEETGLPSLNASQSKL